MAYMRAGPYFYVQGGKAVRNRVDYLTTPQLYALYISTSWTTDSPLWKALSSGPAYNLLNGVASPDNKTLTTLFQQQFKQLLVNQYSIDMNTWTNTLVQTSENLMGIRPVMDPTSGLVYIAGQANMAVLDPRTMAPKFLPIANTTMLSRSFPGAVYHPGRKSILYLGGFTPASVFESGTYVTEYIIATNTWSTFTTEGVLPTVRADHCMAINEDGSKIIVFGGRIPISGSTTETSFTGTLYILDVTTGTWTPGQGSNPQLYMACTIVGDQLIAWGGFDGVNTIDGPPIVYSLSTNTWINSYTAPAYYASSARPTSGAADGSSPSPPDSSSSSSSNLGAILGGNPQDEGDRDHTVDYDPIGYTKANFIPGQDRPHSPGVMHGTHHLTRSQLPSPLEDACGLKKSIDSNCGLADKARGALQVLEDQSDLLSHPFTGLLILQMCLCSCSACVTSKRDRKNAVIVGR
ncbi:MAG: hypothetical protein J3R72DRAFT_422687 [Linnemannia gamsii]|nr:MAG: hypothetical protein J3R72DRAFT_422687 [Linnemannia gamsii]